VTTVPALAGRCGRRALPEAAAHSENSRVRDYATGEIARLKEGQSKITALTDEMNGPSDS